MSLYPDILFHFTKKDALPDILRNTFKVSYAREKITGPSAYREFAVPMVSFCDLKLSELKDHMSKYGNYGIGLTKEWANKKGLSPVMYVNKHASFLDGLLNGLTGVYSHMDKLDDFEKAVELNVNYRNIMNTYRYIKNYEGELKRDGKVDKNYRFAEEREWRYVPKLTTRGVNPFVAKSNIKTKKQKENYNKKIEHVKLSFEPDDIKYLIVEKEEDIQPLITHVFNVKGRFTQETKNRLVSRILTADQINNDI